MAEGGLVRLAGRAVISLAGEDRRAFLQGLISNDINKVAPDRAIWAAFLTPQGKFLFDLFIAERGEILFIDAEAERLDDLIRRLSMYRLRSKVTIAALPGFEVLARPGDCTDLPALAGSARAHGGGVAFVDPRLAAAGLRLILPKGEERAEMPFAAWDGLRLRLGLPDGGRDLPIETALLLENGFDELGGVDFQKGCYMGQELTARTKYRGLIRKRLLPVRLEGGTVQAGTILTHDGIEAGEMRSSLGEDGLALIRLDHFVPGGALMAGDVRVLPSKPDWVVLPH